MLKNSRSTTREKYTSKYSKKMEMRGGLVQGGQSPLTNLLIKLRAGSEIESL